MAHFELGIHHHSKVVSSRPAPQPGSSCSVPMSLAQRSALIPVGHCEVSVGMIFRFLKFFCTKVLPLTVSAMPLPHSRFSTVGILAERTCCVMVQVVDEDTELFCPFIDQPVAVLLQYPDQVTDCYPSSLAVEVIFNPVTCSFTPPMCLHLPKEGAEGHGIKGISKIKVYCILLLLFSA